MWTKRLLSSSAVLLTFLATACTSSSHVAGPVCAGKDLKTLKAGTLTLSTGALTRSPWIVGGAVKDRANDPRLGKGYDAAVGYELAKRLGFDRSHVTWIGLGFFDTLRPGAKAFDVGINQATITAARRRDVDLSAPYWVERQVVVTLEGRAVTKATTMAQLSKLPLAVVHDTPATQLEGLTLDPVANLDDARRAVTERGVQGLVTDYNTGLRLDQTESELVGGQMVAVLPANSSAGAYGMVLQKGSTLTSCVDSALRAMRDDGMLDRLEKRWLVDELRLHDLG